MPTGARFRSILDNLLSNAIRYTPPKGEILLAAEETKDFVQFTVRDSARRIEAEEIEHHLRSFQHLLEKKARALAWRWSAPVDLLAADTSIESRLGHGTTLRFTIPVAVTNVVRHPVEVG